MLWNAVDFGVSAQLDKTVGRRNTFIGTPYWWALCYLLFYLLTAYLLTVLYFASQHL